MTTTLEPQTDQVRVQEAASTRSPVLDEKLDLLLVCYVAETLCPARCPGVAYNELLYGMVAFVGAELLVRDGKLQDEPANRRQIAAMIAFNARVAAEYYAAGKHLRDLIQQRLDRLIGENDNPHLRLPGDLQCIVRRSGVTQRTATTAGVPYDDVAAGPAYQDWLDSLPRPGA